jgi:hypothetical protein
MPGVPEPRVPLGEGIQWSFIHIVDASQGTPRVGLQPRSADADFA